MVVSKPPPKASMKWLSKFPQEVTKTRNFCLSPKPANLFCGCHTQLCQDLAESCKSLLQPA